MRSRDEIWRHWNDCAAMVVLAGVPDSETMRKDEQKTILLEVLLDIRDILIEFQEDKEQIRVGMINLARGIEALLIAYFTKEKVK